MDAADTDSESSALDDAEGSEPPAPEDPEGSEPPAYDDPAFDDIEAGLAESAGRDATPSVLAVVVAHEPGDWFEDTLTSIITQDYARLALVVIDAAGDAGLRARVLDLAPHAVVVDAADSDGFSAAANAVLDGDHRAAFTLICHDDVSLAPDTVRILVSEALRSNAGVVGPKLVHWDDPRRLQHVGLLVDRFAGVDEIIEPDERDQEQYDAVVDVFAVPSACVLIRSDLFVELGGFDPAMTYRVEDVDLCWRAQLAGARVLVAPDAVVRHREQLIDRRGVDDVRRLRTRHQLRAVLVDHGRFSRMAAVPLFFVQSVLEGLVALLTGRFGHVRDIAGAWTWNMRRLGDVHRRRRALREVTRVRPIDARALQVSGSVRINAFIEGQIGRNADGGFFAGARRELVTSLRTGTTRAAVAAWVAVVVFVLFGGRALITKSVPAVGDFARFPDDALDLLEAWWIGWRPRDLGSAGSSPLGVAVLGVLSFVLAGSTAMARTVLVVAPVLVGLAGIWRVLRPSGSRRARIGALVGYAVLPLHIGATASGSLAGLIAYAVVPWVVAAFLAAQSAAPYPVPTRRLRATVGAGVAAGVATGLGMAFEPAVVVASGIVIAGLLLGVLLVARPSGSLRLLLAAVVGTVVAAVLALPMVIDLFDAAPSLDVLADGRDGSAGDRSAAQLLRFDLGPDDPGLLVWALAAPAALPLIIGRRWRFELSVRMWAIALVSWAVALTAEWGWLPFGVPDASLLLAPAAAALAVSMGLAVASVEHDLRLAGFGWRQALVPLVLLATMIGMLPALSATITGRWGLPRGDFASTLPLVADDGDYRVLWIGHPEFLGLSGRPLGPGLAWAATTDGLPTIANRAVPADDGAAPFVVEAIDRAVDGDTSRIGRHLGVFGVRYIVVLERPAPAPFSDEDDARPAPTSLTRALGEQLDLERVGANSAVIVYRNTAWTPTRAAFSPGFDDDLEQPVDVESQPLGVAAPVLAGGDVQPDGPIPSGAEIYVAQTRDEGWTLTVDGAGAARRRSIGWATAFLPDASGVGSLSYTSPWWRQAAALAQAAAVLIVALAGLRRLVIR